MNDTLKLHQSFIGPRLIHVALFAIHINNKDKGIVVPMQCLGFLIIKSMTNRTK